MATATAAGTASAADGCAWQSERAGYGRSTLFQLSSVSAATAAGAAAEAAEWEFCWRGSGGFLPVDWDWPVLKGTVGMLGVEILYLLDCGQACVPFTWVARSWNRLHEF